jgi:polyisoprenoid-binding protein YceI
LTHYRIIPERSWVEIRARSNVHPIQTRTDGLEGDLELDVRDGHVAVQSASAGRLSLRVDRLSSGNPLEDRELRRRIDARRYPTIEGELTGLQATNDEGRYRVRGNITFRGVTHAYEDEMTCTSGDDLLEMAGEATFDIRDFGMEPPQILLLRVEPEVQVTVHVEAETT